MALQWQSTTEPLLCLQQHYLYAAALLKSTLLVFFHQLTTNSYLKIEAVIINMSRDSCEGTSHNNYMKNIFSCNENKVMLCYSGKCRLQDKVLL